MLLIDSPEIESRYVLVRTFEWKGFFLVLRMVYFCAGVVDSPLFIKDS